MAGPPSHGITQLGRGCCPDEGGHLQRQEHDVPPRDAASVEPVSVQFAAGGGRVGSGDGVDGRFAAEVEGGQVGCGGGEEGEGEGKV